MAGRKAATVSAKDLSTMKVPEALSLRAKVESGQATPADKELLQRVVGFWRARYQRGALSEKVARQLGIV